MATKLIYQPRGRAGEYAAWALNIYRGCDHGCTYCYAPATLRMNADSFHVPAPRPAGFFKTLEQDCIELAETGIDEQVLLCFSCDPYQHLDIELEHTRKAIQIMKRHGIHFVTLTKGGSRALRDLDLFTPADAFATTLTCCTEGISREWEPGASSPDDRMAALKTFHGAGIPTWVSLEPVLFPDAALQLIEATCEYVDLYKVGAWNYDPRANAIDWYTLGHRAVALLENLGKAYYIKEDLRAKMGSHAK